MEKYLKIVDLIVTNSLSVNEKIKSNIRKCNENPDEFISENSRMLSKEHDLLWFALIDGLIKNEYGTELERYANDINVLYAIEEFYEKHNLTIGDFPENFDDNELLDDILNKFNQAIQSQTDYTLVNFDIDSDTYIIALVSKTALKEIYTLVLNHKIIEY